MLKNDSQYIEKEIPPSCRRPPSKKNFTSYENVLTSHECQSLIPDLKLAFTAKALQTSEEAQGDHGGIETYSSGSTFFLKANEDPSCLLEYYAREMFNYHAASFKAQHSTVEIDPATSGAEWWTQVIDTRDDIGIHWDRDYGLEDEGVHLYPYLATVTYITNGGGATIVFDCPGTEFAEEELSTEENPCVVRWYANSFPKFGKHIAFDGRLLHAAPSSIESLGGEEESELEDDDSSNVVERMTFLVNVWINHSPIDSRRYSPSESEIEGYCRHKHTTKESERKNSSRFNDISKVHKINIDKVEDSESTIAIPFTSGERSYILPLLTPKEGLNSKQGIAHVQIENGVKVLIDASDDEEEEEGDMAVAKRRKVDS